MARPRPLRVERFEDRTTPSAAPYAYDPSFGTAGRTPTDFTTDYSTDGLLDTAVGPDGDVWELVNGKEGGRLLRFNADGTPDAAFGTAGVMTLEWSVANSVTRLAVQPDGRVLVGGVGNRLDPAFDPSSYSLTVARLTADGALDPTFGTAGQVAVTVRSPDAFFWSERMVGLDVAADGSILAAGRIYSPNPSAGNLDAIGYVPFLDMDYHTAGVIRLTPDGRQDTTFGTDGVTTADFGYQSFLSFATTADGGFVFGGVRRNFVRDPDTGAATAIQLYGTADKFDANGRPDVAFDGDGHAEARLVDPVPSADPSPPDLGVDAGWALAQADGGVVVGVNIKLGYTHRYDYALALGVRLVRFEADGAADASFGTAGGVGELAYTRAAAGDTPGLEANDLIQLPDGSLQLLATASVGGPYLVTTLVRYTADGQPSPIVGESNRFYLLPYNPAADALLGERMVLDGQGRLVVAGLFQASPYSPSSGQMGVGRLIDPSSPLFPADAPSGELLLPGAEEEDPPLPPVTEEEDPPLPPAGETADPPPEPPVQDPWIGPRPISGPDGGSWEFYVPPLVAPPPPVVPGDLDGDGIADTAGANGPAVLVHLSGTGTDIPLTPFEASFTGGVAVARADLDGDGRSELIVSAGDGGGGRVQVYSLVAGGLVKRADFFGIADLAFRGGATATTADLDGDGIADLVVAAGVGGGPRVAVFAGRSLLSGDIGLAPPKLLNDFFAFGGDDAGKPRNGVTVAAADLNGDGRPDLVFGAGVGGAPRVYGVDGADLSAGRTTPLVDFFVGDDPASRDGTWLTTQDVDGDGKPELVARGSQGTLRVYDGRHLADGVGREPAMLPDAFAPIAVD